MYEFVNKPRPVIFHVLLALTLIYMGTLIHT
jgi:hypothetical protein